MIDNPKWQPITEAERLERLAKLRVNLASSTKDAAILTPGSNLRYFLGLAWAETERFVCAIVTQENIIVICPKFEDTALFSGLSIEATDYEFWEEHEDPYSKCRHVISKLNIEKCILDPNCSYGHATNIMNGFSAKVESAYKLVSSLRSQKTDHELSLMQVAKHITDKVHREVFTWIKPGMKASEVNQKIDRLHRSFGADNGSSFCAVQFGEATSHPHGVPGDQVLRENDLILIDTGCTIDGYNSDITRTYALNKVSPEIERIWDIEKEAQLAVFEQAKPGVSCESLDYSVRNFLNRKGLQTDYNLPGLPHRLGHGIGLDIHEGPYLVKGDKTILARGMCFSNEPMIVVPNKFGVRLEDHFYVSDSTVEWFTEPQHSLYQPYL